MNRQTDLQSILQQHLPGYESKRKLNARQRQVCSHVSTCRTLSLGGRELSCDDCEYKTTQYYSCRDRHCPKCQHNQRERWCERQRADVLPVTYHHLVFTLPAELNGWIGLHPELVYQLLFTCAWRTLARFGADPKRLNGQMGMTAMLHTWGENLSRHVHLHCLVPGGALSDTGVWHTAKSNYLFPVRALSRCFRGMMVSALRTAAFQKRLNRVSRDGEIDQILAALMSKNWVVFSKPCPMRAEAVIDYLGRYSYRVAISDQRLLKADSTHVYFSAKDYCNDGRRGVLKLETTEFIRRYLLHVLPKGLMRIRHYGFLANRGRKEKLCRIRTALQRTRDEKPVPEETNDCKRPVPNACPRCKYGQLHATELLRTTLTTRLKKPITEEPMH